MKIYECLIAMEFNERTQVLLLPLFSSVVCTLETKSFDRLTADMFENETFLETSDQVQNSYIHNSVHFLKDYPEIEKHLMIHFNSFKNQILAYNQTNFEITTSWITKTERDGYCLPHKHQNSFYSGLLYFGEYDDNVGEFHIISPTPSQFGIVPIEENMHNCSNWSHKPTKNSLIFFPSYLAHYITRHKSDIPRYSLAFNICPVGKYGHADTLVNIFYNEI